MAENALEGRRGIDEECGGNSADPVAERGDLARGVLRGVAACEDLPGFQLPSRAGHDIPERLDAPPRRMVRRDAAEEIGTGAFRPVVRRHLRQQRRCQVGGAPVIVRDDGGRAIPRQVDEDVPEGTGLAQGRDRIGIRRAGNEEIIDRIGNQGFDDPQFLLRVPEGGGDDRHEAAFPRQRLEALRKRREVAVFVQRKAQAAGIKVVAHEGPGLNAIDWDFELAAAQGFGETHAELLAQKMGGKGEYAMFVGSLTVPLHNSWADYANAYIAEKYPEMKLIGERYGVAESVDDSRKTALDLMAANPNLTGFLAFGSQGPIGIGRAIEEQRKIGQVHVLGPFSPGQGVTS